MHHASTPLYSLKQLLISDSTLLPVCVNPHAKIAEADVQMWATSYDIALPRMDLVVSMTSFLYPQADLARLIIIGKLMYLLFYVDDVYGDLPTSQGLQAVNPEVVALIETCCFTFTTDHKPNQSHKLVEAFWDVRREMENYAPPSWMKYFSQRLADHLLCSANPALFGWDVSAQSLQSYVYVRELISGMYPTIDFIEFANGLFLPQAIRQQPLIGRLQLNCARIACLTNDLFSYHKEVIEQGLVMNLLQVIQTLSGCDFEETFAQAIAFINHTSRQFFDDINLARENNWSHPNNGIDAHLVLDAYLTGLQYELSATWHWQMNTNRYRSPFSPFEELRSPVEKVLG
jgi:hypothetical protein